MLALILCVLHTCPHIRIHVSIFRLQTAADRPLLAQSPQTNNPQPQSGIASQSGRGASVVSFRQDRNYDKQIIRIFIYSALYSRMFVL